MKHLSLGFIFDTSLSHVLLVHKNSPAWQAGKINGVGGKAEAKETTIACMVRECAEETALDIPAEYWLQVATMLETKSPDDEGCTIDVFTTKYIGPLRDAYKNDHEEIEWISTGAIPEHAISNLHFLIPLAKEHLRGHDAQSVVITY